MKFIRLLIFILLVNLSTTSRPCEISHDNDDSFTLVRENNVTKSIYKKDGIFYYSGPMSELVSFLLNISSYQIMLRNMVDYEIRMTCNYDEILAAKKEPFPFIEKRLSLDIEGESMTIDGFTLDIVDPKILYKNINKEDSDDINLPYISDSNQIKADKATVTDIAKLLTDTKHKPYFYAGEDNTTYRWNLPYKNNSLMRKELETNYGIQITRETLKLPIFVILPLY